MMEDNRVSPRCSIRWRCALVVEEHGRQETIQCRTNDVSSSGVSVICHRNIPPPKAVTVYLLIDPGDDTRPQVVVEAQGQIRNNVLSGQQGGFRLGIEFAKFARDGKQILQKYLPKELSQPVRAYKPAREAPAAESDSISGTTPAEEAKPLEETEPPEEKAPAEAAKPAEAAAAVDAAPATGAAPP